MAATSGREKDTIMFSTVVNDINSFVDDANLINVAVSRSVKEFISGTSNQLFKRHRTNIGNLLYSDYSRKLLKVMQSSKHLSEFKSENLMYSVIEDVLPCFFYLILFSYFLRS